MSQVPIAVNQFILSSPFLLLWFPFFGFSGSTDCSKSVSASQTMTCKRFLILSSGPRMIQNSIQLVTNAIKNVTQVGKSKGKNSPVNELVFETLVGTNIWKLYSR